MEGLEEGVGVWRLRVKVGHEWRFWGEEQEVGRRWTMNRVLEWISRGEHRVVVAGRWRKSRISGEKLVAQGGQWMKDRVSLGVEQGFAKVGR